jgi:hypothetical protein
MASVNEKTRSGTIINGATARLGWMLKDSTSRIFGDWTAQHLMRVFERNVPSGSTPDNRGRLSGEMESRERQGAGEN